MGGERGEGGGGSRERERGPFSGGTAVGGEATARSHHGRGRVQETAEGAKTHSCWKGTFLGRVSKTLLRNLSVKGVRLESANFFGTKIFAANMGTPNP